MAETLEAIKTNWRFLSLLVLVGVFWADSKHDREKLQTVADRLSKKISVQNEIKDDISSVKEWIEYQEGYKEGYEKAKKELGK